jgi:chemotaxis protein methyltransferase CheR
MSPEDFTFVSRLLKDRTGLILTRDKSYLLENRLASVVRTHLLPGLTELVAALRAGDQSITADTVDAMLSKETAFFRDWQPFKHLEKVVFPTVRAARQSKRTLRILCAGTSTGQEAYSVAMQIKEGADAWAGWRVDLVGIDLSPSAIATAERGLYSQFEVQRGLPVRRLLRHFEKRDDGWHIRDELRRMVSFRHWNLLDDLYPLGRFDIVFCRNVLISFDQQTKLAILQRLARVMMEDGVLMVGADESLAGVSAVFRAAVPKLGIYVPHRAGMPPSASPVAAVQVR